MEMVKQIQTALDSEFYPGIKSYHQRSVNPQEKEFFVFKLQGETVTVYADNVPIITKHSINVLYFNQQKKASDVQSRSDRLVAAMEKAGFRRSECGYELGDIDDTGHDVVGFDFVFSEVLENG